MADDFEQAKETGIELSDTDLEPVSGGARPVIVVDDLVAHPGENSAVVSTLPSNGKGGSIRSLIQRFGHGWFGGRGKQNTPAQNDQSSSSKGNDWASC